jgi:hypothetical protein
MGGWMFLFYQGACQIFGADVQLEMIGAEIGPRNYRATSELSFCGKCAVIAGHPHR